MKIVLLFAFYALCDFVGLIIIAFIAISFIPLRDDKKAL